MFSLLWDDCININILGYTPGWSNLSSQQPTNIETFLNQNIVTFIDMTCPMCSSTSNSFFSSQPGALSFVLCLKELKK